MARTENAESFEMPNLQGRRPFPTAEFTIWVVVILIAACPKVAIAGPRMLMLMARMQRWLRLKKFPGSLSVAFVTVAVVGLSTYFGRSP